jgi:hypothetical protein
MPTIFRTIQGWAVRIYANDHRPPHVHVVGPDAEARFELLCDLGMVRPVENFGCTLAQLNSIARQLTRRVGQLCAAWGEIHG